MIFEVTQEALDLNYDGMIIETHIDPDNAWSDAAQQVTPDTLKQIIKDLTIRKRMILQTSTAKNDKIKS